MPVQHIRRVQCLQYLCGKENVRVRDLADLRNQREADRYNIASGTLDAVYRWISAGVFIGKWLLKPGIPQLRRGIRREGRRSNGKWPVGCGPDAGRRNEYPAILSGVGRYDIRFCIPAGRVGCCRVSCCPFAWEADLKRGYGRRHFIYGKEKNICPASCEYGGSGCPKIHVCEQKESDRDPVIPIDGRQHLLMYGLYGRESEGPCRAFVKIRRRAWQRIPHFLKIQFA